MLWMMLLITWIKKDEYIKNFTNARQHEYHLFKAVDPKNQTVGLIGYQFIQQLYAGRYMHIDTLVVANNVRRQGVATQLMEFVFDKFEQDANANNCKDVRWDTGNRRDDAKAFYAALGVEASGVTYAVTTDKLKKIREHKAAVNK